MATRRFTIETIKVAYARSAGICAFPGCGQPLIINGHNAGYINHIEAANPKGPRHNSKQTEEQRNSPENLLVTCERHRREIDKIVDGQVAYSVEQLQSMKREHESRLAAKAFTVSDALASEIADEMEIFWQEVDRVHREEHVAPDLAVEIDANATFFSLMSRLREQLRFLWEKAEELALSDKHLERESRDFLAKVGYDVQRLDALPYWENMFIHRHWELHNLAIPNTLGRIAVLLDQAELRYLEKHIALNGNDIESRNRLEQLKQQFIETARSAGLSD